MLAEIKPLKIFKLAFLVKSEAFRIRIFLDFIPSRFSETSFLNKLHTYFLFVKIDSSFVTDYGKDKGKGDDLIDLFR